MLVRAPAHAGLRLIARGSYLRGDAVPLSDHRTPAACNLMPGNRLTVAGAR